MRKQLWGVGVGGLGLALVACVAAPPQEAATGGGRGLARPKPPSVAAPQAPAGALAQEAPPAAPSAAASAPPASPAPVAEASASPVAPPLPLRLPLRLSPERPLRFLGQGNEALLADPARVAPPGSAIALAADGRLLANHGGNIISNHGGGLITNNGGNLVAQGGGLITNNGGNVVSNHSSGQRLLAQAEAPATPTLPPDLARAVVFKFVADQSLGIVDLVAFLDQCLKAWAQSDPVLGRWTRFTVVPQGRVQGGVEIFPFVMNGRTLSFSALARLQGGKLEVAFLAGAPADQQPWLVLQEAGASQASLVYDLGPMLAQQLPDRVGDAAGKRFIQNGKLLVDLPSGAISAEDDLALYAQDAPASGPFRYRTGFQNRWRLKPEADGLSLQASRYLFNGEHTAEPDKVSFNEAAMKLLPSGEGVLWFTLGIGSTQDPRGLQPAFARYDTELVPLASDPQPWGLSAQGFPTPAQPQLLPLLPPKAFLGDAMRPKLPPSGGRFPLPWRPLATEGQDLAASP